MDLGLTTAAGSWASMNPFMSVPTGNCGQDDGVSTEKVFAYLDRKIGPQLLYTKGGIRGSVDNPVRLTHSRDRDSHNGHLDGMSADELYGLALKVRLHLAGFVDEWASLGIEMEAAHISHATTVLGRAARADNPGLVFASAASRNEIDPLTDVDARLFAGLRYVPIGSQRQDSPSCEIRPKLGNGPR